MANPTQRDTKRAIALQLRPRTYRWEGALCRGACKDLQCGTSIPHPRARAHRRIPWPGQALCDPPSDWWTGPFSLLWTSCMWRKRNASGCDEGWRAGLGSSRKPATRSASNERPLEPVLCESCKLPFRRNRRASEVLPSSHPASRSGRRGPCP